MTLDSAGLAARATFLVSRPGGLRHVSSAGMGRPGQTDISQIYAGRGSVVPVRFGIRFIALPTCWRARSSS